ncbi:MAG: NAD-dependent epimerase/dehydratase family protein [Deltaproteobacteria bacterium]|nr:MAG: NAD-dependent epimerase/dehydratase family protein [Deltaproteobacteria bacterium]
MTSNLPPNSGRIVRLRLFLDVMVVNLCLMLALLIRYAVLVGIETTTISPNALFHWYMTSYFRSAGILTLLLLGTFWLHGLYQQNYLWAHKLRLLFQAVSLGYLSLASVHYLSQGYFYLPRGAYFMAWALTFVVLAVSRLLLRSWERLQTQALRTEESYHPNHILVIGGAGYIGSALVKQLLEQGYHVRILDLLLYGTEPIQEHLQHPNLEIRQADFRQVDQVLQAMQGIDTVVHLGAIVGDPACALNEPLTVEVNVIATRMIAEIAKGCGVRRFLFASTCSVYGQGTGWLTEESSQQPVSLYARSKQASEQALQQLASDTFSPTILRFGTLYGISGRIRFDLVVNLLTAKAVQEKTISVFGGSQWRPFLHVNDAAKAIVMTLQAPIGTIHNEVFNVGSQHQNFTIDEIAQLIQNEVPEAEVITVPLEDDLRDYRVTFEKLERELGFHPSWTLEQGIRQVAATLQDGTVSNYRDARFSNIKHLQDEGHTLLTTHYFNV